ncbi:hypothetical protein AO353_09795 [Pseudomonas fluorescens]|uniref:Uncharacterized protein n=1 Tax=Pseudomonas fluorescens TaxID=294 RepID=A0A0N9WB76_PSEFL|nr:hypothetical protein AO353_09795 [Pseudomonas fluorescens]
MEGIQLRNKRNDCAARQTLASDKYPARLTRFYDAGSNWVGGGIEYLCLLTQSIYVVRSTGFGSLFKESGRLA